MFTYLGASLFYAWRFFLHVSSEDARLCHKIFWFIILVPLKCTVVAGLLLEACEPCVHHLMTFLMIPCEFWKCIQNLHIFANFFLFFLYACASGDTYISIFTIDIWFHSLTWMPFTLFLICHCFLSGSQSTDFTVKLENSTHHDVIVRAAKQYEEGVKAPCAPN